MFFLPAQTMAPQDICNNICSSTSSHHLWYSIVTVISRNAGLLLRDDSAGYVSYPPWGWSWRGLNFHGLNRDSNPGPLAPKARIIPLDHWATNDSSVQKCFLRSLLKQCLLFCVFPSSQLAGKGCKHKTEKKKRKGKLKHAKNTF